MPSKATTVDEYLASLPADRVELVEKLRKVFLKNKDKELVEGMQYGMIGYFIPHSVYPDGYHCDPKQPLPFAGIGNQKGHVGIYMFCLYGNSADEKEFRKAWAKSGKKLDMGKSCIRIKKMEDVPLDVIAKTVKRATVKKFIEHYESAIKSPTAKKKAASRKKATKAKSTKRVTKKTTKKKAVKRAAKKPVRKKAAKKKAGGARTRRSTR